MESRVPPNAGRMGGVGDRMGRGRMGQRKAVFRCSHLLGCCPLCAEAVVSGGFQGGAGGGYVGSGLRAAGVWKGWLVVYGCVIGTLWSPLCPSLPQGGAPDVEGGGGWDDNSGSFCLLSLLPFG